MPIISFVTANVTSPLALYVFVITTGLDSVASLCVTESAPLPLSATSTVTTFSPSKYETPERFPFTSLMTYICSPTDLRSGYIILSNTTIPFASFFFSSISMSPESVLS